VKRLFQGREEALLLCQDICEDSIHSDTVLCKIVEIQPCQVADIGPLEACLIVSAM
jgi:hypothetical protein